MAPALRRPSPALPRPRRRRRRLPPHPRHRHPAPAAVAAAPAPPPPPRRAPVAAPAPVAVAPAPPPAPVPAATASAACRLRHRHCRQAATPAAKPTVAAKPPGVPHDEPGLIGTCWTTLCAAGGRCWCSRCWPASASTACAAASRKDERRDLVPREPPAARFVLRRQRRPAHRYPRRAAGALVVDELLAEPARRHRRRRPGRRGRCLPGLRPRPAGRGNPEGGDARQPDRLAIRTKLLEVYAKRRDTKGFELLATQLFALTSGEGDEWAKAQELGPADRPGQPALQAGRPAKCRAGWRCGSRGRALGREHDAAVGDCRRRPISEYARRRRGRSSRRRVDLDLDLDMVAATAADGQGAGGHATDRCGRRSDRSQGCRGASGRPNLPTGDASAGDDDNRAAAISTSTRISLDLDGSAQVCRRSEPALDYSSISSALDGPIESTGATPADPLVRKLELADEFRQIGDKEGARDLLEEVVAKASGAAEGASAQSMLDGLA